MNYFNYKDRLSIQLYYLKRAEHFLLKGNWFMYNWNIRKAKLLA